jgi:MOSC domain-containing protein YiiM
MHQRLPSGAAGSIVQVNVSKGGVPKLPVSQAAVGPRGLDGDQQRHGDFHGGPDRAVCLYAIERIEALAAEGHAIAAGSAGENVTVRGIDWDLVVPGARVRLGGEVLLEITSYTPPCRSNARWFAGGDFNRINQKRHPGWSRVYARVLCPGGIQAGDLVELVGGCD